MNQLPKEFIPNPSNALRLELNRLGNAYNSLLRYFEEREKTGQKIGGHYYSPSGKDLCCAPSQEPPKEKECDRVLCQSRTFRGKNVCEGFFTFKGLREECPCICHSKPELNVEELLDEYAQNYKAIASCGCEDCMALEPRTKEIINLIRANLR